MHIGKNGTYRTAQPSVRSFAPADILPESQGTNSVHGTWSSEGEAGRHFRTKAQRIGASNPLPFSHDWIGSQNRHDSVRI